MSDEMEKLGPDARAILDDLKELCSTEARAYEVNPWEVDAAYCLNCRKSWLATRDDEHKSEWAWSHRGHVTLSRTYPKSDSIYWVARALAYLLGEDGEDIK